MDWKQAVGEGILGAGAAAVVSLPIVVLRWAYIGMKSDYRKFKEKRASRRAARQSATRVEPPISR